VHALVSERQMRSSDVLAGLLLTNGEPERKESVPLMITAGGAGAGYECFCLVPKTRHDSDAQRACKRE
jgi:hypothetical protein